MSKEAVKKITTDANGNTVITVKWNRRTFIVQINEEGIVVAPPGKDGNININANPSVWIDPFAINKGKEELYEMDKGEAPLLVHTYFDNADQSPVTVRGYKKRALLGGDGLVFAKLSPDFKDLIDFTVYNQK